MREPYITTGASGSSFDPPPFLGKCAASSRDTASMPLITPRSKSPDRKSASISWQIFSQPAWPTLAVYAAVGNDLEVVVGQQQVDQTPLLWTVSQIRNCEKISSARSRAG